MALWPGRSKRVFRRATAKVTRFSDHGHNCTDKKNRAMLYSFPLSLSPRSLACNGTSYTMTTLLTLTRAAYKSWPIHVLMEDTRNEKADHICNRSPGPSIRLYVERARQITRWIL